MAIKIKTKIGEITIENDVIATIVGGSAIENPGVVGMASRSAFRDGMNQILNRENYAKGVVIHQEENGVNVDVYLVAQYGTKLSEISKSVQGKVRYNLDALLGIHATEVNVIVQGVRVTD
ncbi:Asp23/Gls24 family envelope stress response protein [Leuconostoc gelidum subsp. aenigmaticum]|uniref:Asp23/Gls24 family envelope stress response protein n=1 Tax=Leuconostoc gelidum TaxID=1244 RepID=UPI001CC6DC15|nr:Asp23/Gls24 family envelope stress response protein [Leuconostoc gelidum]MBZ6002534.1 Asp23/Gls24 family envelope stress response protein [Leuconostoc gelidum subsp. aenigmaticum]